MEKKQRKILEKKKKRKLSGGIGKSHFDKTISFSFCMNLMTRKTHVKYM